MMSEPKSPAGASSSAIFFAARLTSDSSDPTTTRMRLASVGKRSVLERGAMLFGGVVFKLTLESIQVDKAPGESFVQRALEMISFGEGIEESREALFICRR